ncbi:MAG TPA: tetratricopeptide repeat protein [Thermoanaerobaculia bacterium]|nr:tetratricopeptide repeat protein [Thermoanaerobaculia bacterium]
MSIDYALWKWKEVPSRITPWLCYLLLAEGVECPEVAPLDIEGLNHQIEAAFPDPDALSLIVDFGSSVMFLETYGSTPVSVVEWFVALAEREGMVFFDPQEGSATKADEKEYKRRVEEDQRRADALRAEASLAELRAQAAAGDPKALFRLGNCYSFGEGVTKDLKMAFALFERSAKAGYSDGMFNLAACYRLGEGVAKDAEAAISWYQRAAETDPRFAFYALGEMYANGETGTVDKEKAAFYLQLSWDKGNAAAYRLLLSLGVRPQ